MPTVRTERQPKKIALMRFLTQSRLRIVEDLIRLQIKHRDRLLSHCFLRAIAVVEHSGVVPIWTHDYRRGKAIGAANSSGRGYRQHLAGGEHDRRAIRGRRLRNSYNAQQ